MFLYGAFYVTFSNTYSELNQYISTPGKTGMLGYSSKAYYPSYFLSFFFFFLSGLNQSGKQHLMDVNASSLDLALASTLRDQGRERSPRGVTNHSFLGNYTFLYSSYSFINLMQLFDIYLLNSILCLKLSQVLKIRQEVTSVYSDQTYILIIIMALTRSIFIY